MLFIFSYANIAKRSRTVYNPATGETRNLKVKETEGSSIAEATAEMVRKAVEKYGDKEKMNIYLPNAVAVPIMEALKVRKYVIEQDFDTTDEDEVEVFQIYCQRIAAAGIALTPEMITTLKKREENYTQDEIELMCAITEVAMVNQWTDRDSITYLLGLQLRGNSVRSIDSLLVEPKKETKNGRSVVMSPLTKTLREIASNLLDTCALPELTIVEEDEE